MAYVGEQTRAALAVAPPGWAALRRRWLRFAGQLPVLPLSILVPFLLVAVFANLIAPYDPTEPIPDDPGPLLPDSPEELPPPPTEPSPAG